LTNLVAHETELYTNVALWFFSALVSMASHCKKLHTVDVGWCQEITDEGVVQISNGCATLQYLGLMRCDKVTNTLAEQMVVEHPNITYSTMHLDYKKLIEKAKEQGIIARDVPIPNQLTLG